MRSIGKAVDLLKRNYFVVYEADEGSEFDETDPATVSLTCDPAALASECDRLVALLAEHDITTCGPHDPDLVWQTGPNNATVLVEGSYDPTVSAPEIRALIHVVNLTDQVLGTGD